MEHMHNQLAPTARSVAAAKARKYSRKYFVWYVREVSPGVFEPWAHDSGDERTVAKYIQGTKAD